MATNRREFLTGAAWMGAAALAAGCATGGRKAKGAGAPMMGWADKPIGKLRVGIVGVSRGWCAVDAFSMIPGCEVTAVCDITDVRRDNALKFLASRGFKNVASYGAGNDENAWKKMCERDDVDLVWNATPWQLHVPIALHAMNCGKHVAIEVPSALTLEDCWALVETSERTRRHCIQMENCCYGETEMLALNLVKLGMLGDLVHGEGAYIHDLRKWNYGAFKPEDAMNNYWNYWRLRYNVDHAGNQYETHGLGPICLDMGINRGDRFDYLVSVDSPSLGFKDYARHAFGPDSKFAKLDVKMADMNSTIIKTVRGRTILVQHDVANARPYDRLNLISGTRGILQDYPFRLAIEPAGKVGEGCHSYDAAFADKMRREYMHPLWKQAGEIAQKVGGHGGMDFLMCLRLAYCLQCGLPLDMDVYDLAAWCSLGELTEYSATHRGRSMDVPDFTRGAWEKAVPREIGAVDFAKMGDGKGLKA